MKKFLFATLMVVMGVCAQAQIVSSSSSRVVRLVEEEPKPVAPVKEPKPIIPFEPSFYVKGGPAILIFSAKDEWILSYPSSTGYSLVFGYDKPFFQDDVSVAALSWGIEAGLSSRGTTVKSLGGADWASVLKHSLIANPKLTFKVGGPKFSWNIDFGAFLSFDYAMSFDAKYDNTKELFDEWTQGQNVDAGLSLGTSFWISHFQIGVNYLVGFTSLFDTEVVDKMGGRTDNVQFHVGWIF